MNIKFLIPVYNELSNLPLLPRYLKAIKSSINSVSDHQVYWSIAFADNDSSDGSLFVLGELKQVLLADFDDIAIIAFAKNYGFSFSTSYLVSHADSFLNILIPADMQIPAKSIVEAILISLASRRSSFLCRNPGLNSSQSAITKYCKNTFYSILSVSQKDNVYQGFFGMGCYIHDELSGLYQNQGVSFRPFQLRLILPALIHQPNLVFFDERSRFAGRSSFGFMKYINEAISILARSDFIYQKGLKLLVKSIIFTIILCIFFIFAIKMFSPASIIPGFATIILVQLASALSILLAIYILTLRQERSSSSVYDSLTVSFKKVNF
jgi:hypothetical protein